MMFVPPDHYQCVRGWGGGGVVLLTNPGARKTSSLHCFYFSSPPSPKHPSSRIADVDVVNEICPETTEKLR